MRIQVREGALAGLPPGERKLAERELQALASLYEDNPLLAYQPHEKQHPFHLAKTNVKAFIGGNRSGKTTAGVNDDLIQALPANYLAPHLLPYKRFDPPFYCRIITPDTTQTMEGVIFQKLREWCPRSAMKGGSWDSGYHKDRRILEFECGSWLQFMSYEQDLEKFGGAALHRVHYDEEPPESIRRECLMRLMDYGGDELFTFTPLHGMGWTYDAIWMKRHSPNVTAIQVSIDDNPAISTSEKERVLADLSVEERMARERGEFVHFAGLVYPRWSDELVVPTPEPSFLKDKVVVVGIDPGLRFTGVVWGAFDNENDLLIYDELKLEGVTVETVCDEIRDRNKRWAREPDMYVIDPSARNRSLINAEAVESVYARNGIYTVHGQNDLEAGIAVMRRRMEAKALLVAEHCHQWLNEAIRYRIDPKPDKFAVVKTNDHLMDASRYLAMSRTWTAPVQTRSKRPAYHFGQAAPWKGYPPGQPVHPLGPMA